MIWERGLGDLPPKRAARRVYVSIHISRRRHRMIVAGGIVACGVVTICWPDASHISGPLGTAVNLFWLIVEPT